MAITEQEREQERIAAIHRKRDVLRAQLERVDRVMKTLPTPGLNNQAALLNYQLKILGDNNSFL